MASLKQYLLSDVLNVSVVSVLYMSWGESKKYLLYIYPGSTYSGEKSHVSRYCKLLTSGRFYSSMHDIACTWFTLAILCTIYIEHTWLQSTHMCITPSLSHKKGFKETSKMPRKANEIIIKWTNSRDVGRQHQVYIEHIIWSLQECSWRRCYCQNNR